MCSAVYQYQLASLPSTMTSAISGSVMWTCNPCKWEADIWGWFEVRRSARLHYTVNQHLHWACRQYGHSGGTGGWLGVKRCQFCMQDTSPSASEQQLVTRLHNELSLCVKCCKIFDIILRWQLSLSRPIRSDHLSIADHDDNAFGAGTLTWQNPVHSWKAGPGKVLTVENKHTSAI